MVKGAEKILQRPVEGFPQLFSRLLINQHLWEKLFERIRGKSELIRADNITSSHKPDWKNLLIHGVFGRVLGSNLPEYCVALNTVLVLPKKD